MFSCYGFIGAIFCHCHLDLIVTFIFRFSSSCFEMLIFCLHFAVTLLNRVAEIRGRSQLCWQGRSQLAVDFRVLTSKRHYVSLSLSLADVHAKKNVIGVLI